MESISKALRDTEDLISRVRANQRTLTAQHYQQTPHYLLDALVDLSKAKVSLESALSSRVADLAIEGQTRDRAERGANHAKA